MSEEILLQGRTSDTPPREIRMILTPTVAACLELLYENRGRIEAMESGQVELNIIRKEHERVRIGFREAGKSRRISRKAVRNGRKN